MSMMVGKNTETPQLGVRIVLVNTQERMLSCARFLVLN